MPFAEVIDGRKKPSTLFLQTSFTARILPYHQYPIPQREPLLKIICDRCIWCARCPTTGPTKKLDDRLHAERRNFYKVEKWSRGVNAQI